MCYLYNISDPKISINGTRYRTLRLQLNKGFDSTTLTVNAFENTPNHDLRNIIVNSKVRVEVLENNYFKLLNITSYEFEDCYRCAAPVMELQLGQTWCHGCYNKEKMRIVFKAIISSKTETFFNSFRHYYH